MSTLTLDPAFLEAGPEVIDAVLADVLGEPVLIVVPAEGHASSLGRAPGLLALRRRPVLTVGVDAAPGIAGAFDLTIPASELPRVQAAFARAPITAVTAALLVRTPPVDVWTGLVAESTTYSMLQAGPEFAAWLASRAGRPAPTADPTPRVRSQTDGRVSEVVLTRPRKHNALDPRLRDELDALLAEIAAQPGAIIVRAEGPSFCSGGDLDTFGSFPDPATAHGVRLARSLAWRFAQLAPRLVVGLHGACLGAGIELPAFAGIVVAADDARIGLPELGLGLVPGAGGTVSIPRRAGSARLLDLLLRDDTIGAQTALEWGLVDEVVSRAEREGRCAVLARDRARDRDGGPL